jgi:hypothetical protein
MENSAPAILDDEEHPLGSKLTLLTERCCGLKCSKERGTRRFLSFKLSAHRLFRDIADAITKVEKFTSGMDMDVFPRPDVDRFSRHFRIERSLRKARNSYLLQND